jgi:prophage antirepressor-like protein
MTTQVVPFLFETQSTIRVIMIDGNPWFVAIDIAEILAYRMASDMTRFLDDDEIGTHNLRIRSENNVEQDRAVTIINESGLYSAILKSRKPEAKKFKKWVTAEVLPSIRKTGSYSTAHLTSLSSHTVRAVQIGNSKAVNHVQVAVGGKNAAIAYNVKNCTIQSGKTPCEWKEIAKIEGIAAKYRDSGKNVLRVKRPQVACGMSLADQLIAGGASVDDGIGIGKDSQPIFQRILALGITPPELLI